MSLKISPTIKSLTKISIQKFLDLRFNQLPINIDYRPVKTKLNKFNIELLNRGFINFKPKYFIADEWFQPEGTLWIGIPFYLFSKKLTKLEEKMIGFVEGKEQQEFLRLLRHEAGHCFESAYKLSSLTKWRKLFGDPRKKYDPHVYRKKLTSKSFVSNLETGYGQSHPEEDFAETFAVCINPDINWQEIYKDQKIALKKLLYVDYLIHKFKNIPPKISTGKKMSEVNKLSKTLKRYYSSKRKLYADDIPSFYLRDLLEIFNQDDLKKYGTVKVSFFIKKRRKLFIKLIKKWLPQKIYNINLILDKLILISNENNLRVNKNNLFAEFELSVFVTAMLGRHAFQGEFRARPKSSW